MRKRLISAALSMIAVLLVSAAAVAQTRPYRGTVQSVRGIILRLENRSATFRNDLENWTSRNPNDVNALVVNETAARQHDLHVGSTLRVGFYDAAKIQQASPTALPWAKPAGTSS